MDDDRTGQVIGGYRVERQLGRGAFGVVWLAARVSDGKSVVLKILHQQWAKVPTVVERFRREGQVAGKIMHPHVAQVYAYATTDEGVPYIALEYLPGGTLKQHLKDQGPLPTATAAELWAPVCEAVGVAHTMGIVHRDLKPENVMLTTRGANARYPVVLDFGIAKFLDSADKLTSTGTMLGTPTYMAPEQCRGQTDIGPPADVYSLGAICFELLAGRPPFTGKTVAELAMKHLLDAPPPLPNASPALAEMVARCLAKEPEKRPNAHALAGALRAAASGAEAAAPPAKQSVTGFGPTALDVPITEELRAARAAAATGGSRAPSSTPTVEPESSVAATVLMSDGDRQAKLDEELRRRRPASRRPPVVVIVAVAAAVVAVAALVAVALTVGG